MKTPALRVSGWVLRGIVPLHQKTWRKYQRDRAYGHFARLAGVVLSPPRHIDHKCCEIPDQIGPHKLEIVSPKLREGGSSPSEI
jgi:hypothetical protein